MILLAQYFHGMAYGAGVAAGFCLSLMAVGLAAGFLWLAIKQWVR